MENYKKGKNIEEELSQDKIPIENLPEKLLWMHVKGGTKVANVVEYAEKVFNSGEYKSVVWSGSGGGVSKTISCAEIMKRNYSLHQITRLSYQKIEEYWEPIVSGLEEIVVCRQIPSIHILLSLDELDSKALGYQSPKSSTSFWVNAPKPQKQKSDYAFNRNNRNFTKDKNRNNNNGTAAAGGSSSSTNNGNNRKAKSGKPKKPKQENDPTEN